MSKFEVGQRAYLFGGPKAREDGTNVTINEIYTRQMYCITEDGKNYGRDIHQFDDEEPTLFHRKPSFVEPPPPKKKVKKMVELWVNQNPTGVGGYYKTEGEANSWAMPNRVACVHVTGEYEVEE